MKKTLLGAALVGTLALAGCGSSDDDSSNAPTLNTPTAINAYLEGKTWLMAGDDLPAMPNGFSEDVAAFNQCYNQVQIQVAAATWNVHSVMGTIDATPNCTHQANGTVLDFASENARLGADATVGGAAGKIVGNGECFDISVNYGSFTQEGRGSFSADGKTLSLELYFAGQATGATCTDGAVGSGIKKFLGTDVTTQPDSVQVYRLQ